MRLIVVFVLVVLAACSEEVLLPVHHLSRSSLSFDLSHPSTTLYLRNTGQSPLPWTIQVQPTMGVVTAEPQEGSVSPGDSVAIVLTADLSLLTNQELVNSMVQLTMPATFNVQIPVNLVNFKEEKLPLDDEVIDAEYSRTLDAMIIVTASGKLIILDPETRNESTVELPFKPTCVSVSPDGKYAVVGHVGVATYVNLESLTIEREMGLSLYISDIVLTNSAWAYIMEGNAQWTSIRSVNFNSQEDITSWASIYSDCIFKLHPDEKHIYAATTRLMPSDFLNMEINDGVVSNPRDSPYHGDYEFGDNIWFADDGTKVFGASGNVFLSSDDPTNDLTFSGKIPLPNNQLRFHTLDHSSSARRLYGVIGQPFTQYNPYSQPLESNDVTKYDLSYNVLGTVPLEHFVSKDVDGRVAMAKAEGRFGFFNSRGTKFYVIVRSGVLVDTPYYYTGVEEKWGVVSIDVD